MQREGRGGKGDAGTVGRGRTICWHKYLCACSVSRQAKAQICKALAMRACVCVCYFALCVLRLVPAGNTDSHTYTHQTSHSVGPQLPHSHSIAALLFLRCSVTFAPLPLPRLLFMLCAALHHYKDLAAASVFPSPPSPADCASAPV